MERLSQSEFNLDKLEVEAAASAKTSYAGGVEVNSTASTRTDSSMRRAASNRLSVPGAVTSAFKQQWKSSVSTENSSQLSKPAIEEKLTIKDVERDRGQPLSKYDRNIMIFNWLLTLEPDGNATESYQ